MENILFCNPDIRQLVHNVNIGPQAEVAELINRFNNHHVVRNTRVSYSYDRRPHNAKPLSITKKFYWKPGAYDTIRQVIYYASELDKKACSLWKLVDRAKQNGGWRIRNISQDIASIEAILMDFRQRGIIQQDNTDDAVEAWELFKNHLIKQFQESNGGFDIYIEERMYTGDGDISPRLDDYHINIVYKYNDVKINYRHYGNPDSLAEILLPGEGHITIKLSVTRVINAIITANMKIDDINRTVLRSRRNNQHNWFYALGGNYETFQGLNHPYIAAQGTYRGNDTNEDFKHVCLGNIETEVRSCIKSFDFISLKVFFDRMMTHYDTQTGPLNRINRTYHGQPKFLEKCEEYHSIITKWNTETCLYPGYLESNPDREWMKEESYCAKYCTLKKDCSSYKRLSKDLTKKELELEALEQATINAARRVG